METQNKSIETTIVEKNETLDELELLRKEYELLKKRLDKQDIVNETLMKKTFSSKVKSIHNIGWTSALLGVFVIIVSPFAFHYNPVWNLSWAFVGATDIMMLFCIYKTWEYHFNLSSPRENEDLVKFAASVKKIRDQYKDWIKTAFVMIAGWLIWMAVETIVNNDDKMSVFILACAAIGATIGGIIGYRMDKNVIRNCDEILSEIETIKE